MDVELANLKHDLRLVSADIDRLEQQRNRMLYRGTQLGLSFQQVADIAGMAKSTVVRRVKSEAAAREGIS